MAIDAASAINALTQEVKKLAEATGAGFPTPTIADAGQVLMVDAEGKWKLGTVLPAVETTDEGKVLTVDNTGTWTAADVPTELPAVEGTDEGKVLTVTAEGEWAAESLPADNAES